MRTPKLQYGKSKRSGQWYWRLVAKNGRITASGKGLNTKQGCLKSITRFVDTVTAAVLERI